MKTPIVLLILVLVLAGGATAAFFLTRTHHEPVEQPIKFNHSIHIKKANRTCVDCHTDVDKGAHATIPGIKTCMLCHKDAQGTDPEEPKVREFAKEGKEIPWKQVNNVVGHVYFSHVAHVKYGKLDCRECHGDTTERTEPVTVPQIDHLTMKACMACHTERNVSNDCLVCHK